MYHPSFPHTTSMRAALACIPALCLAAQLASGGQATIRVDATAPGTAINPRMFGIFLEEINFGVDGGLYAELIRNRGFEDAKPPEGYQRFPDGRWRNNNPRHGDSGWEESVHSGLPHWSLVQQDGGKAAMCLDTADPLHPANPRSLRLEVSDPAGKVGVANEGFWGIHCAAGAKYDLTFHARCADGFDGNLTASLDSKDGTPCSDTVRLSGVGPGWKKFTATLTGKRSDPAARFVLTTSSKGKLWLDFVSLFPQRTFKDRKNGLRPDIAQLLADLRPGFVRFPGGCVVEGGSIGNAYNWKKTVGPLEAREEIWGCWGFRRTHGMGFLEYFRFCEDIGAKPMPVLFAGETCGYRDWELVPVEQNQWVIDNYLDLMEYATGPADSKWGKIRAAAGQSAPFKVDMIGIGNENAGPAYNANYPHIYKAVKGRYPELTTISCLHQPGGAPSDMVDDHYYNNPFWFLNRVNHYDKRDRKSPPVLVGEAACNSDECGPNGNLFGALAEAAFYLGLERNGDVVRMACYAPLLANVRGKNWPRNLIYFDSSRTFAQPSYYAQKMLMHHCSDTVLPSQTETKLSSGPAELPMQFHLTAPGSDLELKDLHFEKDGKILLAADLANPGSAWEKRGNWEWKDGALACRNGGDLIYQVPAGWRDCTLSLKLRKTGGNIHEGCWLRFAKGTGNTNLMWNLGNQTNKRSSIEGGGIENGADFAFETGRWYDLRLTVKGGRIQGFVDGKMLNDATVPPVAQLIVLAGKRGPDELIVKAVNTSAETVDTTIDLQGVGAVDSLATLVTMAGDSLTAENSFEQPLNVSDKTSQLAITGPKFGCKLPPFSFTAIRVKTKAK